MSELGANVTIEVPEVDSILVSHTHDRAVVAWTEHDITDWIGMADECLKEVGDSLVSLIVPDLEHRILSSSEEVARVVRDAEGCYATSVDCRYLTEKDSFVSR